MSKFRIYRTDSADPRLISRQNKKLYMAYGFLCILVMFAVNIHINSGKKSSTPFFYIVIGILIFITILVVIEMRRQSKSLRKIGILEFKRSSVSKKIGDLTSDCPYDNIIKIEIERHLRALSMTGSSGTSTLTYIVKIVHKDLTEENFVVSDRSIDFGQKISIMDTLKTLKSTAGLYYVVKNTS